MFAMINNVKKVREKGRAKTLKVEKNVKFEKNMVS